jgi:hypothetical protein
MRQFMLTSVTVLGLAAIGLAVAGHAGAMCSADAVGGGVDVHSFQRIAMVAADHTQTLLAADTSYAGLARSLLVA